MRRINYKSDFDFLMRLKDASGKEVPFPDCDWDAMFWTSSKANAYRASCMDGVCVNCRKEADGIRFIFDNHRLGMGTLKWEPHFEIPDAIYPDGARDTYKYEPLDIELVNGQSDCDTDVSVIEATLPAVYLTAYDLAVRNGYTGTYEDFVAYTNRFPQVVETSEAVNALLSDFADGKAMIADALTRQGVDTSASESMQTMADKVLGLQLAVQGDPQYVEHDSRVGGYDLYNVMHNHRKAEFPYMYAVSFNAPTVTLSGADAYLCSDGYYTEESGTHKLPPAMEHYVIYYFRNKSFTLTATAAGLINEMCVYNGAPIVNFDNAEICKLAIYGAEPFSTDNVNAFSIGRGHCDDIAIESLESGYLQIYAVRILSLRIPNFKVLRGGTIFSSLQYILSAMLPSLQSIPGGTVVGNCYALAELSLPALATVSGGTVASNCSALAELSLPALATVYCTKEFNILWNCDKIFELSLPNVAIFSTTGARTMIKISRERSIPHDTVDLPVCEMFSASFASGTTANTLCELHFGVAINAIYTLCNNKQMLKIKIGKGAVTFVSTVSDYVSNWDTEALKQFISDLGDNTDGSPKQIQIGASQIAKLSDEDIALAVAWLRPGHRSAPFS